MRQIDPKLLCLVALAGLGAAASATGTGFLWTTLIAAGLAVTLIYATQAAHVLGSSTVHNPDDHYYRRIFDSCPQPIWVHDRETLEILAVNEAALHQYGYSSQQFSKLRAGDLVHLASPQPNPGFPSEPFQHHRRKDGSIFPVEVASRDIHFARRNAALVVVTDDSARVWSEKRASAFTSLARRLSSAHTPLETAHILLDTADQLFGWDACTFDLCEGDLSRIRPVLYMDTIGGKRVDVSANSTGTAGPQTRQAMEQGPFLILRPDPSLAPDAVPFGDKSRASASLMFAPIRQTGQVIGVLSLHSYLPNAYTQKDLSTFQDLGDLCGATLERIRVENELVRLNTELEQRVKERTAQLEAINHELEAFSYSVSHDLRAPLRSIRGFSEVLLERYCEQLDPRAQEFLRRSCESSRQMDNLIEVLLELSRVGRTQMKVNSIDLSALATSIAAELRKSDPNRKVEFVIAPNLSATGDERLLRIALNNLLANAWKFTARIPLARIEFGYHQTDPAAFYVRDNGAGFDMAYAAKLFGVFQRLHTAAEFPGTGIGLATVQRIINRHGGKTWATGELNRGATFYFTLPGKDVVP